MPAVRVAEPRIVASGLAFPEGPTVLADRSILVVELAKGRLSRVDPSDGAVTPIAEVGGSPNGAALGPDGWVYLANNGGMAFEERGGSYYGIGISPTYKGGLIQRVDLASGGYETVHESYNGRRLAGPNDLVFGKDGSLWFTDQPKKREHDRDWGAVYHSSPSGALTRVIDRLDDPNGIGLSPDETRLYVAETNPGRVQAWGIEAPGVVRPLYSGSLAYLNRGGRMVGRTSSMQWFDSMAVTAAGELVVGTLGEPGGLTVIDPERGVQEFVVFAGLDETFVTNVCFAGPHLTSAYVTLSVSGLLIEVDWPTPGLPLAY
jgi:gluconolactonase